MSCARWRRLRALVLAAHPLCARCGRSASEVHHVVPVDRGKDYAEKERLAYTESNLMPLCRDCHKRMHMELDTFDPKRRAEANRKRAASYCEKFFGVTPGAVFSEGVGSLKSHAF